MFCRSQQYFVSRNIRNIQQISKTRKLHFIRLAMIRQNLPHFATFYVICYSLWAASSKNTENSKLQIYKILPQTKKRQQKIHNLNSENSSVVLCKFKLSSKAIGTYSCYVKAAQLFPKKNFSFPRPDFSILLNFYAAWIAIHFNFPGGYVVFR